MRRSSRAQTTQSFTATVNQASSSSSSSLSVRADRSTKPLARQDSFKKSTVTGSPSEDDMGSQDRSEPEARQTRQKKRERSVKEEVDTRPDENLDEEDVEEEDVTRCICRRQEYPGPPVSLVEGSRNQGSKENALPSSPAAGEAQTEDAGSLFIQCDTCHVWQHGGCVGIMEEAMSPENYYCEECRKDLHKIMVGAKGQKYSLYLPVYQSMNTKTSRKPSSIKDTDARTKEAELRAAASLSSAKRRSTMNSRAALEEEELIRKAIEESKSDGSGAISGNGGRKSKRAREELDERLNDLKRRKTGSDSESLSNEASPLVGSDDEHNGKSRTISGMKKSRGAAAPVHRDRDTRDRENEGQRERDRLEAAGRRKGRAERRRVDGEHHRKSFFGSPRNKRTESEAPEEPMRANVAVKTAPRNRGQQTKPPIHGQVSAVSHRKGAKPVRRGRVGRNQYTKERDNMADKNESPRASNSRDSEDAGNGVSDGQGGSLLGNGSKPSKPRHMNPNRTSMNDLRKRAAGILEYISQTQVEIAGDSTPPSSESKPGAPARQSPNGASKLSNEVNGDEEQDKVENRVDEATFKELGSLQMMDILTRELVLWQRDHGKFGEK